MPKFPEPPDPLSVPPETVRSPQIGNRLWRIHFAGGSHPTAWNEFRHYGPTQARFDHHDAPPRTQSKGILYAAMQPQTYIAEVFQATRFIDRAARQPWL